MYLIGKILPWKVRINLSCGSHESQNLDLIVQWVKSGLNMQVMTIPTRQICYVTSWEAYI